MDLHHATFHGLDARIHLRAGHLGRHAVAAEEADRRAEARTHSKQFAVFDLAGGLGEIPRSRFNRRLSRSDTPQVIRPRRILSPVPPRDVLLVLPGQTCLVLGQAHL